MPIHTRRLDQTHDRRRPLTAAQRTGEQPVGAPKSPWPDLVFDGIVIYRHSTVFQVARQRYLAFKTVIQGLAIADPLGTRSR